MRTVRLDEQDETEDTTEQTEAAPKKRRRRSTGTRKAKLDYNDIAKEITDNSYQHVANVIRLSTAWLTDKRNIMEEQPAQAIAYGSLNFGLRKALPRFLPASATTGDKQDVKDLTLIAVGIGAYVTATLGNMINNITPKKSKPKIRVQEVPIYPTDEEYYEEPYMHDMPEQEPVTAKASNGSNDGIPDGWEDAYETPRG